MYVCNAHTKRTNVRSEREKPKPKKLLPRFYFIFYTLFFFLVCHFIVWREKRKTIRKRQCIFYVQHFDCYWIPAVAFRAMCLC